MVRDSQPGRHLGMHGELLRCEDQPSVQPALPRLTADAGENAARRFLEFFAVAIRKAWPEGKGERSRGSLVSSTKWHGRRGR
jgi:hypothetical protein